jgi:Xaa-Pro aminopeptidase
MSLAGELRLRLRKVRDGLAVAGVGAFFASEDADLQYLTWRDTGRALVTQSCAVLWVKDVYSELYRDVYSMSGYPFDVRVHDKDDVKSTLRALRSKSVAVSSAAVVEGVRRVSGKRTVVSPIVKEARSVKTKAEVRSIARSCRMAKAGMRTAREVVSVGVRELDAVAEVEAELRRRGSEKPPFGGGMLLASGMGSADIHAKASLRRISPGPVVVDLGAVFQGYHSDMTRTLCAGSLTGEQKKVIGLVRGLRDEAIDFIRPGMMASSIHRFVDEGISAAGFKFYHLSGHGVGLEVHENPSFSPDNRVRLKPGMVFTVEPGVYLPGKFGVRFEDTVLLTPSGCRKLT